MSLENELKIKQLYQLLPEGVVAPSSWFTANGYSSQLIYKYIKSGWLKKVSSGAYIRPEATLEWEGAVLGLQHLADLPFHVGGLTALNLSGFAHYLPMDKEKSIMLYGEKSPPLWIKKIEKLDFNFNKKPYFGEIGLKKYPTSIRNWKITISSPERAILELLYLVETGNRGFTFQFVAEIFEGLTTLSPRLMNELLRNCTNRKIIRLLFFFANYYNFAWSKYINEDISLGSGKLQIVKNGSYNNKFMITIPKEFNVRQF